MELVKASNVESNVEPENMEKSDTEEENEESDSSLLLSGMLSRQILLLYVARRTK